MDNKETGPLVSVIVPTYNRGWIIREAVDSILSQRFVDFELIVVDDGSTDNTQNILKEYNNNIKVCKCNNQGVSAARNKGIALSSGRFIAFLDSDDLWLPDKLLMQVNFFNANKEAMLCQTEEIWIRNSVRVNPKKRHKKLSGMIFEPSLRLCMVSPSAVMIKRELFEKVGLFDESLPACEDYDLWLRISAIYPVYLIDTPLIIKRGGHADQLSQAPGLDKYRIQAIKKVLESNVLSIEQHRAAVKVLNAKCYIYAKGCLKRGRKDEMLFYTNLVKQFS